MSSEDLSRPQRGGGGDAAAAASAASPLAARPPVRVIVAGCGAARRQGLTEGFRRQAPPGSSIVFVHSDPAGLEAAGGAEALLAAGVAEADALVLASCSEPSGAFGAATQAADAVLMCELLSLQELLERCRPPPASDAGGAPDAATAPPGGPGGGGGGGGSGGGRRQLHVVCLVGSYGMRRTAKAFLRSMLRRAFSFELLIGDELVSAALVQIATHPHNGDVFERLLLHRRGGTQLAMVPAAAYGFGRGGGWATFGLVAEEVMQSGRALALGYRRADGRMLLAPAPDDLVRWSEGDELVVMADTEG
ncbi:hypothetical protein MNEG_10069 [Monoraphidium neglectum]|uniref:Uncharacterized protein n=1 Tax=Monoraphidium neglectum TaxID=145388 RepID=A0A0D2MAB6_9CHLO|nr:hypothetical protein MNEG_10069 [Monoraphidium neglectum]KIY97896.1 hypothetical protein MNEG_10069 [Monoraphidium neglectum]|eukprot:XP_013896916.1 hypothetical protein MNEG_10069 [Monoraphidium neglectum]